MPKFTKETLQEILISIINEYFEDDNQDLLVEVIERVKGLYKDEIDSLED